MSTKKFYIKHTDTKVLENGTVHFGPFSSNVDGLTCINDAYADALAACGEVEAMFMTDEQASKFYINSREYWMDALKELTDGRRG
jgi:hypothetical protein